MIEFGSGDGNQLKYFNFKSYIGYDVSDTALETCRKLFSNDASKLFKKISYPIIEKADLTMSLDVIYHLIEDNVYEQYLETLFSASNRYVIIYASNMEDMRIAPHVKHRKFTEWVREKRPDYFLLNYIPNKYPFVEGDSTTSFADFYIFQKRDNE